MFFLFIGIVALTNIGIGVALAVHLSPVRFRGSAYEPGMDYDTDLSCDEGEYPITSMEPKEIEELSAGPVAVEVPVEEATHIPEAWMQSLEEYGIFAASLVEAASQVLRLEVGVYRKGLAEIDSQIRALGEAISAEKLSQAMAQLDEVNIDWLSKQQESTKHLSSRVENTGNSKKLSAELLQILENQQSQIETTLGNLARMSPEESTQETADRLLMELRKLLDLAHSLRDQMLEILLEIKKASHDLTSIEGELAIDSLTGLRNRAGLEKALWENFFSDPARVRQLSSALVDVDHFSQLMDKHGAIACDRLLKGVARLFDSSIRKDRGFDLAARFDGQRFFAMLGDTGPRGAMSFIERFRQSIEETTFELDDLPIQITVRAGAAELEPDESGEEYYARLKAAADFAKESGRNCTILDEGKGPETIDPPGYKVKPQVIQI